MYRFFIFIIIAGLLACSSGEDKRLAAALEFASDNRIELEKVLAHYKDDSLKLKAARFLIENMPQHYTLEIPQADVLEQLKVKSVKEDTLTYAERLHIQDIQRSILSAKKIYDCQVITADYLIENIDLSFKVWQKRPWAKYYSFDDFCRMILPYRIEHEPLESWKKEYYDRFAPVLDSLYQGIDVIEACNALALFMQIKEFPNNNLMSFELPRYRASFLLKEQIGGCKEVIDFATYILRALGIPANLDMLYFYYDLSLTHYWVSVKDTTGKLVTTDFDIKGIKRGRNDDDIRPKRKIYRQCYAEQPRRSVEGIGFKGIRKIIRNNLIKDVTSEYYGENTLSLDLPPVDGEQNVYLCAFGRKGWVPQAVAPIQKRKAVFKNVGPNLLYFLASYTSEGLQIIDFPFFFNGRDVHYYIPDILHSESVKLIRKAPLVSRIINHLDNALDIVIEYADNPSFNPSHLLYKITDTIRTNYNVVPIVPNRTFRYVRCSSVPGKQLEFAELAFYADDKMEQELPYIVIDKDISSSVQNIKDNDPLSYYTAEKKGASLHLDFLKEITAKKLMFIPRNDDNFIRIGDEYELFFFNGNKGWVSLGKQIAEENYLLYEVPRNAIFWLRNLTRGQEERLFIYEEGKQQFYL
ncbi:hypothetical protein [Parabacteroides bouchesdurhonensis]|uniref:hypothetical protein n=1 Tax=Parabacteroides bouchesdurhonensis TaxID=1936995 RepID=UPI0011C3675D|nr:hypothetical protein [Parabacteroides bouchesdurhonensis]